MERQVASDCRVANREHFPVLARGHISQWSDSQLLGFILQQRHSPQSSLHMANQLLQ